MDSTRGTGRKRIAVIGAGPVGLEAALYGAELGHDVRVFDRGGVGEAIRRWGFVRLFSPFGMNVSPLGRRMTGGELPPDDAYLTGAEYVDRYLQPLAGSRALHGRIAENQRVIRIGRSGIGKTAMSGRGSHSFRLLLDGPEGEAHHEADVVIDCSGTYGNHNWLGDGNVPALGERTTARHIDYVLPDIAGTEREAFMGRPVLLIGSGFSAATALDWLTADVHPDTRVDWIVRGGVPPYSRVPDDPLPERDRLVVHANTLAAGGDPRVRLLTHTTVEAIHGNTGRFQASLAHEGGTTMIDAARVLALVGYRPDTRIQRELQVHHCYATEGPMALATSLQTGDADCLAQTSAGAEALITPEPGFFILGAKSFGRNPHFLIRLGIEQVREVFTLIEGDAGLDLYAADA